MQVKIVFSAAEHIMSVYLILSMGTVSLIDFCEMKKY